MPKQQQTPNVGISYLFTHIIFVGNRYPVLKKLSVVNTIIQIVYNIGNMTLASFRYQTALIGLNYWSNRLQ